MPRQRPPTPPRRRPVLTAGRAARLYRLLRLLEAGPKDRQAIARNLRIDLRGFYRDLKTLRALRIRLKLAEHLYSLAEAFDAALAKLPFPDPHLSLSEAMALSRGRTAAHERLRGLIAKIVGRGTT